MPCCGQKRAALQAELARTRRQQNPDPIPVLPVEAPRAGVMNEVLLRYLGSDSIALRGPHTDRAYYFAGTGATSIVQQQDVAALLRTQLFARVSSDDS